MNQHAEANEDVIDLTESTPPSPEVIDSDGTVDANVEFQTQQFNFTLPVNQIHSTRSNLRPLEFHPYQRTTAVRQWSRSVYGLNRPWFLQDDNYEITFDTVGLQMHPEQPQMLPLYSPDAKDLNVLTEDSLNLPQLLPAREGFTRSIITGAKYSCAKCNWILGKQQEATIIRDQQNKFKDSTMKSTKHEVWTTLCGHVYCGECRTELCEGRKKCCVCSKFLNGKMIKICWP